MLLLVLFRSWTRKYAVTSRLQKTGKACAFLDLFFPASSLWCEVFFYPFKMKKTNILQSFPIDLMKAVHTLTSPSPWGVVKVRGLSSSHRSDVNVGFSERSLDFFFFYIGLPLYTANNQKFKFSDCGYLWSDRLNIAVYQDLLKLLPFLKIIFQTNCLDFNYKLGFSQTQLAALGQWDLPGPHFSAILGARD